MDTGLDIMYYWTRFGPLHLCLMGLGLQAHQNGFLAYCCIMYAGSACECDTVHVFGAIFSGLVPGTSFTSAVCQALCSAPVGMTDLSHCQVV